jgi:hypothetical protein
MPTIDWPEALIPQTAALSLRKAGTQFASPFNGTLQAFDFIAERWVLSASLAQMSARNPRGVDSFCNTLAGGIERVRVWPFHTQGAPRGTLRGSPTVRVAAARGDTVLRIQGATAGANLIIGGGMEVEGSPDLAEGWTLLSNGATGVVAAADFSGLASPRAQTVFCTALGTTVSDNMGLLRLDVPVLAGVAYTLAADIIGGPCSIVAQVIWYTAGGAQISGANSALVGNGGAFQRVAVSAVAPPTAAKAGLFLFARERPTAPGPVSISIDNVQFEAAAAPTPFAGSPTLQGGDFLGCGGQLFQVASDFTLLDIGRGDIPLVNRVRGTIAINSPVTWYRPSCEMVLPAMQAGPVRRPGVIDSTALDLVEVW